jgi:hypothetical protein
MPSDQMRFARFQITGQGDQTADMSVVPLPGEGGADLTNVNRWRDQLGLPPVTELEVANLVQNVEISGQQGQLYEIEAGVKRMLAAVLRTDGVAWFFKMTGDNDLVVQQKPAFLNYLKTFQLPAGVGPADSAPPVSQLPANHPPLARTDQGSVGSANAEGKPVWQVPAGWRETNAGPVLTAKFLISAPDNSQAAVNISAAAGDGGGVVGNVNRWRRQLGLNDLGETEVNQLIAPLDAGSAKGMLIDMNGADPRTGDKSRLVAVIVPRGAQTWFYKLMGPVTLVEREKDGFIKFVQTAQYP